ncbi:MAG TPA: lmo0937 family membrane protein [Thermoanaerobaculia bacterium]|nr:lmo0937 family membrane protein [Thermoanaerobaculia bacterium]
MGNILWLVIVILIILWLGGFALHIGGGLIHALLVIALIVVIFQLVTGRRRI